ncbi:F0F1 ATP synthase subunit A [Ornithobacterium rhinotracheale]|nr:F0F1 ATP synthase subunit A [Ornithobacterium rhinotracheale]MCK0195248.1 F0F1 ATP synthase subunit A [Ornithobacterium rhinotracheale]UOH64728.1 F0F1 ATP synthase subunit A [Ornithobacterium rhinotracheale]UOH66984.1 F0F1 ATP synthase subunit A [Ornithobacterium rhinotracheale]UVD88352.1 F0F1 ATP synthase subunit A [Ornithobacterium rhinotracheale]
MMLRNTNKFLFAILAFFLSLNVFGQDLVGMAEHEGKIYHDEKQEKSLAEQIDEDIQHHIMDSHYFDIMHDSETDTYYGFPLPVILWDNGLKVFMSSEFDHGKKVVEKDGNFYKLYHSKIYKTDAAGTLTYDDEHHPTNEKPLDFSITKTVFSIFIAFVLLFFIFRASAKSYANRAIPKGIGRYMEPLIMYVRDEIAIPNIGEKHYKKYMSFLLTIFFFIWILNIIGMMPFGVNVTGNIAVTFALAIMTFVITNISGNKTYWKHIFDPLGDSMPWFGKIFIYPILVPIELLGIFVKPFSLMIRLYANMTAGHIVLMSLIGLIFIFRNFGGGAMSLTLAILISFIEFFVAALQAYIFTALSALYFGMAVEEHAEEH